MATWGSITPAGGPREVEQARARLDDLRARISTERDRVEQARRDLAAAEAADRDRMAKAFSTGAEPASDVKTIEKARAAVGEAERRAAALDAAIAQADAALGAAVEKTRGRWIADSDTAAAKARDQARRLLDQLAEAIAATNQHAATAAWLQPQGAADAGRPAKRGVGSARSSASWAANGEPVTLDVLLRWVGEVIDPPPVAAPAPVLVDAAAADVA